MKLWQALAAVAGAAAISIGLLWRHRVLDDRAQGLSERLRAALPARLAQWADGIAYGAVQTDPGDFPSPTDASLDAWALFGAAVMDRESLGGTADTYSPYGAWDGRDDRGRALTPWQIDENADRKERGGRFLRMLREPAGDSEYAFSLLAARWRRFRSYGGDLAIAATAASYNANQHRVESVIAGGGGIPEVDALTTGHNYGADVLRRFEAFA